MEGLGRHRPVPLGHKDLRGCPLFALQASQGAFRSSPSGRVAGRWPAQPATIADRTTRSPASRGDSQSGSWSRPDGRNGSTSWQPPSTASGEAYRANDSELLNWVHGTAAYGFLQAYHMYVQPLSSSETAIMPRVLRPRVYTGPWAHRHLKSSLKCCSMRWPAGWSARTLCLSF